MTVHELINFLLNCPPMEEVYVQTSYSALQKIHIATHHNAGFVELKWKENDRGQQITNWILEERK